MSDRGQEAMLATTIAERPGAFAHFIETALGRHRLAGGCPLVKKFVIV